MLFWLQGSVDRANQDIQDMLTAWMMAHTTRQWSKGLPFVACQKNMETEEERREFLAELHAGEEGMDSLWISSGGYRVARLWYTLRYCYQSLRT